jgi:hypothetical protein
MATSVVISWFTCDGIQLKKIEVENDFELYSILLGKAHGVDIFDESEAALKLKQSISSNCIEELEKRVQLFITINFLKL